MTGPKRGFTLIELLVSITIVAIMAAVGLLAYSTAQISARDSKRKQDLHAIKTATELFYNQNRAFPGVSGLWYKSTNTQPWIPQLTSTYLLTMPQDPINLNKSGGAGAIPATSNFVYFYQGCDPGSGGTNLIGYVIVATLENANDPDRNAAKNYTYCSGLSAAAWGPNAYVLAN